MSSSTSSSDPASWSRFLRRLLATAAAACAAVYAFIVLIDPWGVLPFSIPADRAQVSSNLRYAFAGVARLDRFDSAIFGTSTARVLVPDALNAALGTRFVNLGISSSTPYEQSRVFGVFLRHHPRPRVVIQGIETSWCAPGELPRFTFRPFPDALYEASPWPAYREMMSVYALTEAVNQLGAITGLRRPRFGRDGYSRYLPEESRYDAARAAAQLPPVTWDSQDEAPRPTGPLTLQGPDILRRMLSALPAETRRVVIFMPRYLALQPAPASAEGIALAECKRRVAAMAAEIPNLVVLDYMRPTWITREATNYWDDVHFRDAIRDRMTATIVEAARGTPGPSSDYVVLAAP